ncbi:hypothetical protein MAHJHV63_44540 [Mycobacterium avium subsp. hominissuis]
MRRDAGWLVLVDPAVSVTAGAPEADRSGLDVASAHEAHIWVELLAALYVNAEAK